MLPVSVANGTGTTSVTVTNPGSVWGVGNTLIAVVTSVGAAVTITPPSGWLSIEASHAGTTYVSTYILHRIPTIPTLASAIFTCTNGATSSACIAEYQLSQSAGKVDVKAVATGLAGNTATFTAVTNTQPNEIVCLLLGTAANAISGAWSGGYIQEEEADDGAVAYSYIADLQQAASGTTGAQSVSLAGNDNWVAVTVSLLPTAGTGWDDEQRPPKSLPPHWLDRHDEPPNPMALNGHLVGTKTFTTASSTTFSITTTDSNDVIIIGSFVGAPTGCQITSITAAGCTTFQQYLERKSVANNSTIELWWAVAANPLSNVTVTITYNGIVNNISGACLWAYSVTGCNLPWPWDNGNATSYDSTNNAAPTANITTVAPGDLVIAFTGNTNGDIIGAGPLGFTTNTGHTQNNYATFATACTLGILSNQTILWGSAFHNASMILAALTSGLSLPPTGNIIDDDIRPPPRIIPFHRLEQQDSPQGWPAGTTNVSSFVGQGFDEQHPLPPRFPFHPPQIDADGWLSTATQKASAAPFGFTDERSLPKASPFHRLEQHHDGWLPPVGPTNTPAALGFTDEQVLPKVHPFHRTEQQEDASSIVIPPIYTNPTTYYLWYFEVTLTAQSIYPIVGLVSINDGLVGRYQPGMDFSTDGDGTGLLGARSSQACWMNFDGTFNICGQQVHDTENTLNATTGDVVAVAFDSLNNLIWFRNVTTGGLWNSAGNPATGLNGYDVSPIVPDQAIHKSVCHILTGDLLNPFGGFNINLGTSPFVGVLPAGYAGWDPSGQTSFTSGVRQGPQAWDATETYYPAAVVAYPPTGTTYYWMSYAGVDAGGNPGEFPMPSQYWNYWYIGARSSTGHGLPAPFHFDGLDDTRQLPQPKPFHRLAQEEIPQGWPFNSTPSIHQLGWDDEFRSPKIRPFHHLAQEEGPLGWPFTSHPTPTPLGFDSEERLPKPRPWHRLAQEEGPQGWSFTSIHPPTQLGFEDEQRRPKRNPPHRLAQPSEGDEWIGTRTGFLAFGQINARQVG